MAWPTPQDYNEAIQNPRHCFNDPELKSGSPEITPWGLPKPTTGSFASVYRLHCPKRSFAVRCFLHDIPDQHTRYIELSKFILSDDLVYTVDFEFVQQGILIKGRWYPVLKMEWVDGTSLTRFIEHNLHNSEKLSALADRFATMIEQMNECGIAHGDLQHGNILVCDGDLRLVDYDGMYVPSLQGCRSNELGHRNYQHPERTKMHFGPYLDNFSAWVIYLSLCFLAIDPQLWSKTYSGDECLLFRRSDFQYPESSRIFHMLEHHPSQNIRSGARLFHSILSDSPEQIPQIALLGSDLAGKNIRHPSFVERIIWSIKGWSAHRSEERDTNSQQPAMQMQSGNVAMSATGNLSIPDWLKETLLPSQQFSQPRVSAPNTAQQKTTIPAQNVQGKVSQEGLPDWLTSENKAAQSTSNTAQAAANPVPTTPKDEQAAQASKLYKQAVDLLNSNQTERSVEKLTEALKMVSGKYLKLELDVLTQVAFTHISYGERLFKLRKYVEAAKHFENAMNSIEELSHKPGGMNPTVYRMTAECLENLSICYEQDGQYTETLRVLNLYLSCLSNMPQTAEKIKRATKRRDEVKELLSKG